MKRLIFLLMTFSFSAHGFTLSGEGRFSIPTSTVHVDIASTPCNGAGFDIEEFTALVKEANEMYWNKVSTSSIELKMGDRTNDDFTGEDSTNVVFAAAGDNRILATCGDDIFDNPETTGGVGGLSCPQGKNGPCSGILVINAHPDSPLPGFSRLEILTIIGHEIGHALGLGHTSVEEALMYFSISGKSQEYLHFDDMMGITYLYPQDKKVGGLLGACGTLAFIDRKGPPSNGGGGGAGAMALIFLLGLAVTIFVKIGRKSPSKLHKLRPSPSLS